MPADEGTQSYYAHYSQKKLPEWTIWMFLAVVLGILLLLEW